ncbi:hypothetical protein [Streptomyces sp. NPDC093984]|uniref:hypothetical protein n=1 Tax=Streptomyces sp. NPDC093984 TaxID=3366052 RepID=UPI00380E0CD8
MTVKGLLAGVPHAAHIHIDGMGMCPIAAAATNLNGHIAISTTDGMESYGMIGPSLATSGDTSPASALAVTRFPVGSSYQYWRTITVNNDVASTTTAAASSPTCWAPASWTPSCPQVATAPSLCGTLKAMPAKGAATG